MVEINVHSTLGNPAWWGAFLANYPPSGQWEKGHLIGARFGGPDWPGKNFAAQYARFNVSAWKTCENRIAKIVEKAVNCGGCIKIKIGIKYMTAEKLIPYSFSIALQGIGYKIKNPFDVFLKHDPNTVAPDRCENRPENNE